MSFSFGVNPTPVMFIENLLPNLDILVLIFSIKRLLDMPMILTPHPVMLTPLLENWSKISMV
jgi:hypothetical protein